MHNTGLEIYFCMKFELKVGLEFKQLQMIRAVWVPQGYLTDHYTNPLGGSG